ncbi:MAG: DMT family transporter [Pseudomonadota bacterium]
MTLNDWIRLATLSLLWGGSFFFVELALVGLPVLTIVWCRVALAAALLAGVLALRGMAFPGRGLWPAVLVMGLLNNAVPFTLFVLAQGHITGAFAAILNATTPLFTVIVAHLATRDERITGAKALGLAFGFAGVIVLLGRGVGGPSLAALMCLGAAVSYGLAGVFGRRFRRLGVAPLTSAFGQVAASTGLLLPVWLWLEPPWQLGWPGAVPVLAVLGLASLSTALAYLIYFQLLGSAGATNLALVTFLVPVSATVLGLLFLGEALQPGQAVGFALIALGLVAIDGRVGRWIAR